MTKTQFILSCFITTFFLSCSTELDTTQHHANSNFTLHSPQNTNIHFTNTIKDSKELHILDFHYLYNGGGVGLADFNNDGLLDIFLGGNQVSSKLYLAKGNFEYEDITEKAGLNTNVWVNGVSIIDLNNDGKQDIYLSVGGSNCTNQNCQNLLFINTSKNDKISFEEKAQEFGLNQGNYSQQTAFFDADLDGDLDAYILQNHVDPTSKSYPKPKRYYSKKSYDQFYINKTVETGKTTFENASESWGVNHAGFGLGIALTDVNNDGYLDIYLANDFISDDLFYINQAGKKFEESAKKLLKHTSYNSMGVDIADIDNNGYEDIIVVDMLPFTNQRQKTMLGRMNYDKYLKSLSEDYNAQFIKNTLQVHNGNTPNQVVPFSEIASFSGVQQTDWSWTPLFADFDNDTDLDLFITNGYANNITDLDFVNYHSQPSAFTTKEKLQSDILVTLKEQKPVKLPNAFFENKGNYKFEENKTNFTKPSLSNGAVYGDLDNDGDLDLVVNNINEHAYILENKTSGNFINIDILGSKNNLNAIGTKVVVTTTNGMALQRLLAPVRGYLSSVSPILHFGLGEATVEKITVFWQDGQVSTLNNIETNKTHKIEYKKIEKKVRKVQEKSTSIFTITDTLFTPNTSNNLSHDYSIQPLLYKQYSDKGNILAKSTDTKNNLFFYGGKAGENSKILYYENNKNYKESILSDTEKTAFDAAFFDADNDGDEDLLVAYGGYANPANDASYQNILYENSKGEFTPSTKNIFPELAASSVIAPCDYDQDGDIDLFIGSQLVPQNYPEIPVSFFYNNENGIFNNVTSEVFESDKLGLLTGAVWADIDGDKIPELITVGEWMTPKIYKNKNGQLSQQNLINNSGLWRTISTTDIDDDGDIDLLLGNFGTNSRHKASKKNPIKITTQDLDNNGKKDALISCYLKNKKGEIQEFPYNTRDDIATILPTVKSKYNNYNDFSKASYEEFINNFETKNTEFLTVNCLESLLLINDGIGNFETQTLPVQAQWSPINAFYTEDFNGDNKKDIMILGNDNSIEIHNGKQDASNSLLLLQKANENTKILTFEAINSQKSGVCLEGEAYNMIQITEKLYVVSTEKGLLLLKMATK